jgi:Flp pilus assembly protein TadG
VRSPLRNVSGEQGGQALVEFALTVPVIFLVLVALFDVGRLVFINNEIAEAAREGARWGAVQGRAAAVTAHADVSATVLDRIAVAPAPVIQLDCANPSGGPAASDCRSGNLLTVSVETSVQPITPLIGNIIGPMVLRTSAQMTIH